MTASSHTAVQERDAKGSCVSPVPPEREASRSSLREANPTKVQSESTRPTSGRRLGPRPIAFTTDRLGHSATKAGAQMNLLVCERAIDGAAAPRCADITTPIDRDGELVVALRRGDPTAAENLVAAYGDRAYRLATRITRNVQDAEEAMQDAFLSIIRKIDTFRGDATFGSWVYRIVANAAYQCCRGRRRRSADVSLDKLLPVFDQQGRHVAPVVDWSMSVDDPSRQTELRLALSAAIEELPDDYRAVVVLRDVEGLPHRDIAKILGLTVANVKMRVHRARLFLRKRLEAHIWIASLGGAISR